MNNAKVAELVQAIKDERKAKGWSDEGIANYLVGYLGGMIGTIIESSKPADRKRIESDLQYHIDRTKGK